MKDISVTYSRASVPYFPEDKQRRQATLNNILLLRGSPGNKVTFAGPEKPLTSNKEYIDSIFSDSIYCFGKRARQHSTAEEKAAVDRPGREQNAKSPNIKVTVGSDRITAYKYKKSVYGKLCVN